jgi:hypothetical protein
MSGGIASPFRTGNDYDYYYNSALFCRDFSFFSFSQLLFGDTHNNNNNNVALCYLFRMRGPTLFGGGTTK